MKLLFITRNYPGVCDGVGDNTYYLGHALSNHGYQVSVLTSKDERIRGNSRVEVMPVVERWNFLGVPALLNHIWAAQPDWVLLQYVPQGYTRKTGAPFYLVFLALMVRLTGIRLLTTFHEVALRLYWHNLRYVLAALAQRAIAFGLGHLSDAVVTNTGFYIRMLRRMGISATLIPIGSNIPRLEMADAERCALRARLAPKGENIIACFGGVGGRDRRYDLILRGAKRYRDAGGYPFRMVFIGNLPTSIMESIREEATQLQLSDSLLLTGYLPAKEAFKYLSVADLYIILMIGRKPREGGICSKSSTVAAACTAGVPILSNRGDVTDPIFRHGENVFFLDRIDEIGLGKSIHKLLSDNKLLAELRAGALRNWKRNLNWPAIARKYFELLTMPFNG